MVMIRSCLPPTLPITECHKTKIFGAPRGRFGRVPPVPAPQIETPISGIVIHCLPDTYQGYLSKACVASPSLMPCGHASMHYVLDALTGQLSCLVPEKDVAWAFQSYLSNFPLPNPLDAYPGWPDLSDIFEGLSADFYTLNIGITNGNRLQNELLDGEPCCDGPYGTTEVSYNKLIQLIAYLADKYNIPLDTHHIALHDDIVETQIGCEECLCRIGCLICDVTGYCESCRNVGDPTYTLDDEIAYVYGETSSGCRVKISLENLIALINA